MVKFSSKLKRIMALMIAILFALLALSTVIINIANADTEEQLKQKQESLNNDKSGIKDQINTLNEEKSDLLVEKEVIDREVSVLEGEIGDLDAKINEFQEKIDVLSIELDEATVAVENQYEAYKTRVRVMYENSSTGYLDILLNSESISDFFQRIEIVKQITEYDSNMTKLLKERQEDIKNKKEEQEALKQEVVDAKSVILDKKSVLDKKMSERDRMIQRIQGNVNELEKELKKIEAEEAKIRAQIARMSSNSGTSTYTGGAMTWPTPSCRVITSQYGWRLHPVLKYEKLHTGVDIGAQYGAEIVAAKSGTVITSTYNSAYGNYVVIDHGGGVCTLYAHQSSLSVAKGQFVLEGEVIGYVGSTGYSTGPHLHFEVLINGATTDPLGYIS